MALSFDRLAVHLRTTVDVRLRTAEVGRARHFREQVRDAVIIMTFPMKKLPSPLWGRVRVGGRSARP